MLFYDNSFSFAHERCHSSNHLSNAVENVMKRSLSIHEGWSCDHSVCFVSVGFL